MSSAELCLVPGQGVGKGLGSGRQLRSHLLGRALGPVTGSFCRRCLCVALRLLQCQELSFESRQRWNSFKMTDTENKG